MHKITFDTQSFFVLTRAEWQINNNKLEAKLLMLCFVFILDLIAFPIEFLFAFTLIKDEK